MVALKLSFLAQWGGHNSVEKLDNALDDFLNSCKKLWDARAPLHRDTADVFWTEDVLEADFFCDIEGDETQVTVVRMM
jgi:hypothetical protein